MRLWGRLKGIVNANFQIKLHAPGRGCATIHESQAGAFGIPEFRSPAAMDFQSK